MRNIDDVLYKSVHSYSDGLGSDGLGRDLIEIALPIFFMMFILMTPLGIAKGGVFVRIFLLCLSGVVVYFSNRVYILACKKADVSKIANSAQEIGVITFVFAIVCGFVELMALCCSSL